MFFIVWSRFGILVPVIVVASFFASAFLTSLAPIEPNLRVGLSVLLTALVSGLSIHVIARKLETSKPILVDEAARKYVTFKKSAGHFMFLPMRWWPYALGVLGLLLAVGTYLSPPK